MNPMKVLQEIRRAETAMVSLEKRREQRKSQLQGMSQDLDGGGDLLYRILHHRLFELSFAAIIVINLGMVIIETDAVANDDKPPPWVEAISWLILCSFVAELAVRLRVLKWDFWVDEMNIVDFVLVVGDALSNVLGIIAGHTFPVSFLRIVRLAKLTRIAKAFHFFPELRLMMAGLLGSVKAIFWGTILLLFSLLAWSIFAVQFLHPLNKEIAKTNEYDNCDRCSRAYASVFEATLTFCQQIVAGDSWGLVSISVIEHYPATAVFYGLVFLSVGMAILNLILGVVVDVASQAREKLKDAIENEHWIAREEASSHLLELCKSLDLDNDGNIAQEEIERGYKENATFRERLNYIGVYEEDLEVLGTILDMDGDGNISYLEFVTKCHTLKSSETQFMLATIKYYVTVMKNTICKELDSVKEAEKELLQDEEALKEQLQAVDDEVKSVTSAENQLLQDGKTLKEELKEVDEEVRVVEVSLGSSNSKGADLDKTSDLCGKIRGDVKDLLAIFKDELMVHITNVTTCVDLARKVEVRGEHQPYRLDSFVERTSLESPSYCSAQERQRNLDLLKRARGERVELMESVEVPKEHFDVVISKTLPSVQQPVRYAAPASYNSTSGDRTLDPWTPLVPCCGGTNVRVLTLPSPRTPERLAA